MIKHYQHLINSLNNSKLTLLLYLLLLNKRKLLLKTCKCLKFLRCTHMPNFLLLVRLNHNKLLPSLKLSKNLSKNLLKNANSDLKLGEMPYSRKKPRKRQKRNKANKKRRRTLVRGTI